MHQPDSALLSPLVGSVMKVAKTSDRSGPSHTLYGVFIAIAIGLIGLDLLLPWTFSETTTLGLALVAIILAGLPHGVLDIHIALNAKMSRVAGSRFDILWLYIAIGAVGGLAWWIAPAYLIAFFLVLSIWHFSGDFRALGRLVALLVASSILLTPMISHPLETRAIFAMLMPIDDAAFLISAASLGWPVVMVAMIGLIWRARKAPFVAAAGMMAIIGGIVFEPVTAFAIYFCGLHSPKHIRAVLRDTPLIRPRASEAIIYTALTFALLVGMAVLWSMFGAQAPATGAVFGLLVVLTLPHMAIVEHWQQPL